MLAPVLIWAVAIAAERRMAIVSLWALITAAAFVDFIDGGTFPPRRARPVAPDRCRRRRVRRGLAPQAPQAWLGVRGSVSEARGGDSRITSSG